jgi:5-methylcytosine-specific restriction endonuclease McrA
MEDPTIEHLLDRKFGGTDHIANLTLAHKTCNNTLSQAKTLREKIDLILEKRANVANTKSLP